MPAWKASPALLIKHTRTFSQEVVNSAFLCAAAGEASPLPGEMLQRLQPRAFSVQHGTDKHRRTQRVKLSLQHKAYVAFKSHAESSYDLKSAWAFAIWAGERFTLNYKCSLALGNGGQSGWMVSALQNPGGRCPKYITARHQIPGQTIRHILKGLLLFLFNCTPNPHCLHHMQLWNNTVFCCISNKIPN